MFPLKIKEILETQLADSVKSWGMQNDGTSVRVRGGEMPNLRSQEQLYEVMHYEYGGANGRPAARFD